MVLHPFRPQLLRFIQGFVVSVTIDLSKRISMDDADEEEFDFAAIKQGFC